MKHKILPLAAIVVLALATVSIVRTQPRATKSDPPMVPPRSASEQRVAAVGLVEASSENISIASHLPGIVEKVFVTVGQSIRRGDPLVKLDTRALEAARTERRSDIGSRQAGVAASEAGARKARAVLADAQHHLQFAESLADARSISNEEITRRRTAVEIADAEVQAADALIATARASVVAAEAALKAVETDLNRSLVTSPIDGRVLQLRIRPGEFAGAGGATVPWLIVGNVTPLHVRVDIDEQEAWRVQPGSRAIAQVRGNSSIQSPASFVRFEPLVIPKQSLTGASTERVDTRVLQAVYRIERTDLPLFVGQQMDVFIDAPDLQTAALNR